MSNKAKEWEPLSVPLNDDKVWDMVSRGLTGCCFQLDKPLGQTYSEIIKPENIHQWSDLIALIRPGALEVKVDGVNVPRIYANRKNLGHATTYEHDDLQPILGKTQGLNIYQETSMMIAQELAGFSGADSDKYIRKGIGKKLPEVIAKAKEMFIKGAAKNKISKEQAETIFDSIEKSARYQFNASHSYAYALNGYYYSAYPKAHFPLEFFCTEMDFAHSVMQTTELEALTLVIREAQKMGIKVVLPDIRYFNTEFKILEGNILFGLAKVKGVSKSCIQKVEKLYPNLAKMNWSELLLKVFDTLTSTQGESLIMSGAFDWTGLPRARMLHENSVVNSKDTSMRLSDKERAYLTDNNLDVVDGLARLIADPSIVHDEKKVLYNQASLFNCKRKLFQLQNPHRRCVDSKRRLIKWEKLVLGSEFSYTKLDENPNSQLYSEYKCIDFLNRVIPEKIVSTISVIVSDIRTYDSFDGHGKMCYFQGYDETCVFPSFKVAPAKYDEYEHLIAEGQPVLVTGSLFKNQYGQQSFNVEKIDKL